LAVRDDDGLPDVIAVVVFEVELDSLAAVANLSR